MNPASLDERRAADLETRRHAQREFERPLVVEAGAGTGKTATLVSRIVAWCVGPGWQRALAERPDAEPRRLAARILEGVVAITFTEAAAAEMAERVERTLRSLASGEVPVTLQLDPPPSQALLRERAEALRGAVDHLVVLTIHAWCRRLLGAHPVEAGLSPNFEVDADGRRRRGVVRDLLEERLREAYAQPEPSSLLDLAVAGVGPGELEEALLALLAAGVEAEDFAADPLSPTRIGHALDLLRTRVDAFALSGFEAMEGASRAAKAQSLLDAVRALRERLQELPTDREGLAGLCGGSGGIFPKEDLPRLLKYARADFTKTEAKVLGDSMERVQSSAESLHQVLAGWQKIDLRLLEMQHEALVPLLAEARARARARGFCAYEDLLSACARLLDQHPRVAALVRGEIDQLLVDEFQDTDKRQCRIVAQLALEGPSAERPGLFVVGDPKQSIYGWRSADLAAYEDFVARVLAVDGERRSLSVNHRSVPAVLEEVERCVAPVMRPMAGLQPAFESLVASEALAGETGFDSLDFAPVEHWLPLRWQPDAEFPARTRSREATQIEAQALARDLLRLRDECGVNWHDVAVLFRGRGDWEIYLQALRSAGVLFNVEGDRNYFRRREIIDAAAWVRCVMDPGDEVALLAMLRSPSVGVPDAALQPLFAAGLPARLRALPGADPAALGELCDEVRKVSANPPEGVPGLERVAAWALNLEAALENVVRLRASLLADSGDVFVEELRAHTLLEVSEAGRFLGSWRAANLERFFSELADRFASGLPFQEILRELREGVSLEESREEAPLRDLVPDAVRILTLHGAKGLAFDHVYLMQLHKGTGPDRDGVACHGFEGQLEYQLHGTRSLGWGRAQSARKAVADAERARLLYVGATRARQRLVVSALPPADMYRGAGESLSALLDARQPERPDAARVAELCLEAGADRLERSGALHVVPGLRGEAEVARESLPSPEPTDPVHLQRDEARLREARRSAREHMERPLAAAVSANAGTAPVSGAATGGTGSGEAASALGVGSAVHALLESLDLALAPEEALASARAGIEARLPQWFGDAELEAGRRELDALLEELARSGLFARLFELGECVLARELPLLLRAGPDDAPVAYLSGSIDLLYRDPLDGQLVVVDYKTDRAADESALDARAAHHARQGRDYVRALREAFESSEDPRFELWFLRHDRCIQPDLSVREG